MNKPTIYSAILNGGLSSKTTIQIKMVIQIQMLVHITITFHSHAHLNNIYKPTVECQAGAENIVQI